MSALRTVMREIYGLFVDDVTFALSILAWVGVIWLLVAETGLKGGPAGLLMVGGLGGILTESAMRFARKRRR